MLITHLQDSDQSIQMSTIAPTTDCELTWTRVEQWIEWCAPGELERIRSSHSLIEHSLIEDPKKLSTLEPESPPAEDSEHPSWLEDHVCNTSIIEKKLPTRLIHIGYGTEDVRLCLTKDLPGGDVQYLTLSHCWGKIAMPVVTTKENVDQMLKRIPVQALTKTLQDAIVITRRIGLRYLWIDSLCILQGDHDDWLNEAAFMGHFYAGGFLNIVACDAPDGTTGCFFDRSVEKPNGFRVMARADRHSDERTLWNCMPHKLAKQAILHCETSKRAWCFQETFMAPRSVYFSKSQLFWECRGFRACESFPQGINVLKAPLRQTPVTMWKRLLNENICYAWFDLITDYSLCNATYGKDRLIAFKGIAEAYCKAFGLHKAFSLEGQRQPHNYVAGLWRQKMEHQLLWFVDSHRKPRNLSLRSPSWSWASVDGLVHLPGEKYSWPKIECIVGIVTVNICANDQYGEVNGGTMELKCKPLILVGVNNKMELVVEGVNGSTIIHSIVYPDVEPSGFNDGFLFALRAWELSDFEQWGLLLKEDIGTGLFRRVGAYEMNVERGVDMEDARSIMHAGATWTSNIAGGYHPWGGWKLHTIMVI